ncbi:MAG TPA: type II toxin-antitoxin system VapC family toxin [Tepidisphaeraceae bacterium]|nr:type II toxin-antitoxin system VapC family toxin [Tepidisphaeraceae bacterium]
MIVVDTNVVLAVVVRSDATQAALAARARDPEWIVPRLFVSEGLQSLLKYVVVARSMDRDQALKAFKRATSLVKVGHAEAEPVDVLNTAIRLGLTAYDSEYVAMAELHGLRFVTLDGQVLKAAPGVAVTPTDFAAGH